MGPIACLKASLASCKWYGHTHYNKSVTFAAREVLVPPLAGDAPATPKQVSCAFCTCPRMHSSSWHRRRHRNRGVEVPSNSTPAAAAARDQPGRSCCTSHMSPPSCSGVTEYRAGTLLKAAGSSSDEYSPFDRLPHDHGPRRDGWHRMMHFHDNVELCCAQLAVLGSSS